MEENQVETSEMTQAATNGVPLVRMPRTAKAKAVDVPSPDASSLIDDYDRTRKELHARRDVLLLELDRINSRVGVAVDDAPKLTRKPLAKASAAPSEPKAKPARAKAGKRLARRSKEDVAKQVDRVVAHIASHVEGRITGLRAEQIRENLKLDKREVPAILKAAVVAKLLRTKGRKRATTYFVRAAK